MRRKDLLAWALALRSDSCFPSLWGAASPLSSQHGKQRLSVVIRDYRDSDLQQVLEVVRELQAYEGELYDRMMPIEDIGGWYVETLLRRCREERGSLLVSIRDGKLIGYATIFTKVEQTGEIDEVPFVYSEVSHIAVKSSARGTGAGRLLLDECEHRSRSSGAKWLRINVLASNGSARRIYEHLGFHDHLVVMEKALLTCTPFSCRS
ncbi:GNAT family N-acetyltransferase [Xanthobacter autotrophicus DSM 431]|uniref:GNAT family N-acetyltransferase n=1 Tax=Xanthobacter nonsaccharivorans TaxID=3119912 RepID=UPI0037272482